MKSNNNLHFFFKENTESALFLRMSGDVDSNISSVFLEKSLHGLQLFILRIKLF